MSVLKIKHSLKLSDFDKHYRELGFLADQNATIDIEIPRQITKNFFSVTSSLIQFIATWLRTFGHGRLIIDLKDEQEIISKMYEEEFFFPIVSLAWNDVPIVDTTGKNLRPILRSYQNEFIVKMRRVSALKGDKLLLVNLDHFDNDTGILPFFENKNQIITNESSLADSLGYPILNDVLKNHKGSKEEFQSIFEEMIGIVFELMKNTFEWGREDESDVPLSPNIRGLFVRFYKKTRSVLLEEYNKDKAISEYFSNETILQTNDLGQIYFIEISVFDSGVGFIKKFNDIQKINLNEIDILKKCLIKNHTSSKSLFRDKKGIGLDRILRILDGKGLLRIKTDKYCVFRNLIESPYKEVSKDNFKDVELNDWKTMSKDYFTKETLSAGSNISILYPLSIKPTSK